MNGKQHKPEQIIHKLREAEVDLTGVFIDAVPSCGPGAIFGGVTAGLAGRGRPCR